MGGTCVAGSRPCLPAILPSLPQLWAEARLLPEPTDAPVWTCHGPAALQAQVFPTALTYFASCFHSHHVAGQCYPVTGSTGYHTSCLSILHLISFILKIYLIIERVAERKERRRSENFHPLDHSWMSGQLGTPSQEPGLEVEQTGAHSWALLESCYCRWWFELLLHHAVPCSRHSGMSELLRA